MSFFNKKNQESDYYNDSYEYMDEEEYYPIHNDYEEYNQDDYVDYNDTYNNYENSHNYNVNNKRNRNYNQNNYGYDGIDPKEKRKKAKELRKTNRRINKFRKKSKRKDITDYSYSTGYENEEVFYDENGEAIIKESGSSLKGLVITAISILYFIFIVVGTTGTTFSNGYEPQIISSSVRGQRVTYDKCMKQLEKLEELDTFGGTEELQELYKLGNFQGRIPPLKESLGTVTQRISDMESASFKVKEKDYVNVEMVDMIRDLYETQATTLTKAIRFYESMSGYTSTTAELEKAQNELLNQHQVYNNKLSNYKMRFQQIKSYELKLEK